ncbi:protein of unknown function [Candidatus Promineifilum breve]|uniref:Uncharacterized protein n=1 Tax=Candidatus Promineifilum breve TaxID=1806508 RepID=A0A160T2R1_9CHLR|nr:protein of unknown function [Candidatus Promineifilum breve]
MFPKQRLERLGNENLYGIANCPSAISRFRREEVRTTIDKLSYPILNRDVSLCVKQLALHSASSNKGG